MVAIGITLKWREIKFQNDPLECRLSPWAFDSGEGPVKRRPFGPAEEKELKDRQCVTATDTELFVCLHWLLLPDRKKETNAIGGAEHGRMGRPRSAAHDGVSSAVTLLSAIYSHPLSLDLSQNGNATDGKYMRLPHVKRLLSFVLPLSREQSNYTRGHDDR